MRHPSNAKGKIGGDKSLSQYRSNLLLLIIA